MSAAREQEVYTEVRRSAKDLVNLLIELKNNKQLEWNTKVYGDTLDDGTGVHTGFVKADLGAVVFDTTEALWTVLAPPILAT